MALKPEVEDAIEGLDEQSALKIGRIMQTIDGNRKCIDCSHFRGGGDWGLCCDLKYDLCYEITPACDEFEAKING